MAIDQVLVIVDDSTSCDDRISWVVQAIMVNSGGRATFMMTVNKIIIMKVIDVTVTDNNS